MKGKGINKKNAKLANMVIQEFCKMPEAVSVFLVHVEPVRGFTTVLLLREYTEVAKEPLMLVGEAKRCNYAPMADRDSVLTGITIATTRALRAGGLYNRS